MGKDTSTGNALFVFECLLRNNAFMTQVDNYSTNVPELVLFIMGFVKNKLKDDTDLQELFNLFYNYCRRMVQFDTKTYQTCVNLAMLKVKYQPKSRWWCSRMCSCFTSN
jgi:hypothetical protein